MINYILLGLLLLVGGFIVLAAMQADEFCVTRSARIAAAPDKIFPHVNELRNWEAWSPWAKLDPQARSTFAGPAAGVGATMSWQGNNKVGEGRMTIIESKAAELVGFQLDFLRPMRATNTAKFTFQSEGRQTVVTWSMSGKKNFMSKAFGLIINCDQMVGRDFEKGLASLKALTEAG